MKVELTNTRTNLTDWQIKGQGHMENNVQGLLLRSDAAGDTGRLKEERRVDLKRETFITSR